MRKIYGLCVLLLLLTPFFSQAHEAYVLTHHEIQQALSSDSPNPFTALQTEGKRFIVWGFGIAVLALCVFLLSINPFLERVLNPYLLKLKHFAPFIGRLTLGFSLLASGYYRAAFGPELPVSSTVALFLMLFGVLIIVGFFTRIVALLGMIFYVVMAVMYHTYMLTYLNYFGEMVLALIVGGGLWSLDRHVPELQNLESKWAFTTEKFEKYSFLILRLCFGVAVFFASFYAKFVHSNLALDTVANYHLTNYFPFTPLFLVLGAFLVEAILGLCFMIGLEVRFAALVFTFFLTLSILFFGEAVWPHLILFGVNAALFAHGYDKYTLGSVVQGRREGEPIL